jgi:glutathione S-transferase
MKLFVAPRAPNPRRVLMFLAEKGLSGIEFVNVDLNAGEHRGAAFRARSPLAKVPALEPKRGRSAPTSKACSPSRA